jgi:hypothetical protein
MRRRRALTSSVFCGGGAGNGAGRVVGRVKVDVPAFIGSWARGGSMTNMKFHRRVGDTGETLETAAEMATIIG